MSRFLRSASRVFLVGSAAAVTMAALSLAACEKSPTTGQPVAVAMTPVEPIPLAQESPAAAFAPAPLASALPAAPPARRAAAQPPASRYDYVNRATSFNSGFGDSPPDYAVDYEGSRPWVWQARSGAYRVVENTSDGARYYYYDAGSDRPFLVRDSRYAYGYDQGQLAVVYDAQGRPLSDGRIVDQLDLAGRYLARANALHAAAVSQQRQAAYAADWQARQSEIARQRQVWERQQQQNADWRAWDDQHVGDQAPWRQEAGIRHTPPLVRSAQDQTARPDPVGLARDQQARDQQGRDQQARAEADRRAQQTQADINQRNRLAQEAQQAQRTQQAAEARQAEARQAEVRQVEARRVEAAQRQQAQTVARDQAQARQAQQALRTRQAAEARQADAKQAAAKQVEARQVANTQRQQAQTAARDQAQAEARKQAEAAASARRQQAVADADARAKARKAAMDALPRNGAAPQP